ncbi:TIGR02285 family protein [Pseudomonas sp. Pseusp122]|uniref:TIGR02285 family protein n=1 Tax=unclassified Pseudomonas TaxID=196821 RepID=UPI0039A4CD7C
MSSLLLGLALSSAASPSQAKDTLTWLLRDLPPSTIFAGPLEGKGVIDQLMPLLIAKMPEYDHVTMRVNRARGMQMLQETSLTCDPTLIWTAERAKTIAFSIPTYAVISNGLIVRNDDMGLFNPFLKEGHVDLSALLASKTVKLGVVAERSYGAVIDQILQGVEPGDINAHYGNNAIGSLLQMERMGRLQAVIGFWPEARYLAQQQGMAPEEFNFLPIKGAPKYQFTHFGCSNTPQGRQAIEIINREMRSLRQTRLVDLYAQWLDGNTRKEYEEDARHFYDKQ